MSSVAAGQVSSVAAAGPKSLAADDLELFVVADSAPVVAADPVSVDAAGLYGPVPSDVGGTLATCAPDLAVLAVAGLVAPVAVAGPGALVASGPETLAVAAGLRGQEALTVAGFEAPAVAPETCSSAGPQVHAAVDSVEVPAVAGVVGSVCPPVDAADPDIPAVACHRPSTRLDSAAGLIDLPPEFSVQTPDQLARQEQATLAASVLAGLYSHFAAVAVAAAATSAAESAAGAAAAAPARTAPSAAAYPGE